VTLPDFLVIGAPKAGTTALHAALAGHPELFMSPVKEPNFFLTDGPPPRRGGGPGDVQTYREHIWRREDYETLFDLAPPGALRGESTPFYLYDRQAQRRIRALIPDAKMIAVLRDPVERAHSNATASPHPWPAKLGRPPADLQPRRGAAGHVSAGPCIRRAGKSSFAVPLLRDPRLGRHHHRRRRRGPHPGPRSALPRRSVRWYGCRDQMRVILTIRADTIRAMG
jgi:hypothetical protein